MTAITKLSKPATHINLVELGERRRAAETIGTVERVMRMGELEISEYARQLYEAHGSRSVVEAAQKAYSYEEKGQVEEAQIWRRIEAALKLMRGPHAS